MRRRRAAALALALALPLTSLSVSTARAPSAYEPLDRAAFTVVELEEAATELFVDGLEPRRQEDVQALPTTPPRIRDFRAPERSFPPRPILDLPGEPLAVAVPTPTPTPRPRPAPTPKPVTTAPATNDTGTTVAGTASWYCLQGRSSCTRGYPGGLYAAAGPALRVGNWRGRTVTVCANGTCIPVTLIDWCQCYGSRVIDLYSDAFRRLAPLSSGLVRVTVSW